MAADIHTVTTHTVDTHTVTTHQDRGQAAPMVLMVMAIGLLATWIVIRVADDTASAAAARTAADAAALAGALDGETAAREVAADNGAIVLHYRSVDDVVEVVVQVGRARARARATHTLVRVPSG